MVLQLGSIIIIVVAQSPDQTIWDQASALP